MLDLLGSPSIASEETETSSSFTATRCDPVVCRCYGVRESTIVDAVRSGQALDLDAVTAVTKAGEGCTCCHKKLCKLIKLHR